MSKNDKKGKRGNKPDNILQFPQRDPESNELFEDMYEEMIPEFLDYYLPVAVEFASVTAVEIMKFADEALVALKGESVPSEVLEMVFIKLRGLSIIIPSMDFLGMMDEMMDDVTDGEIPGLPDIVYLHDILDDSIDICEELIDECVTYYEGHGKKIGKIPSEYLRKKQADYALEEIRDTAEEVLTELSVFAASLFAEDEDE